MDIFLFLIGFIVLVRYFFVLYKYIKTGEFKKKVYKGNILGVIAYSFLTVLIISFLILMSLASKDKSSDLVMWILFAAGLGAVVMYPWAWLLRTHENSEAKSLEILEKRKEEFQKVYGNEEYDEFKITHFNISDDEIIDNQFNYLISLITNNQISFVHPVEYKTVADVFTSLYQQDFLKLLENSDSIDLTCDKVNSLLKKNKFEFSVNSMDITKDDDDYIKARRKDMVSTLLYDLSKIDEIIKTNLNDYELVSAQIYNKEGKIYYPTYLCIMQKSKYDKFFNVNTDEEEEKNDEQ